MSRAARVARAARRWLLARLGGPFAPYEVEGKIGEGSESLLYLARHRRGGEPVVIKAARDPDDRDARALLEREARALSAVRHESVARLLGVGSTRGGGTFCVLPLYRGSDLESLVRKEGPLAPARAVFVLTQLASALSAVHERGFVHRDVKPANVILGPDDRVTLLDFGLAARLDGSDAAAAPGKEQVVFLGTPGFVAPEQISDPEVRDPRTDVYGLGALAHWLLTGQPMFEGGPLEVLRAQLYYEPPAPGEVLGAALRPELDALVLSCLRVQPRRRPVSARAVEAALLALGARERWVPASSRQTRRERPNASSAFSPAYVDSARATGSGGF